MNQIAWIIFIGSAVALALVILPSVAAQITNDNNKNESQNINSQNTNDTRAVVNLKNHTISVIDTKTNETISVKNFVVKTGNNTANETVGIQNISGNMENK